MADSLALRLPVELLLEIFKLAADEDKDDLGAKTAFRLAAVCQAWRALLLDYGPAWSTLSLARTEVTEIMLQRSKTAPISLTVDLRLPMNHRESDRRLAAARLALSRALDRTRELRIAGRQPAPINQLLAILAAPKPALEAFELSAHEPGHMSVYTLTPAHLVGNMPLRQLALQSTHLSNGAAPLLHVHCSSLVHLDLHTVQGLSLPALLDVLAAARDTLQVIKMESMALSALSDVPLRGIHLPLLSSISFKGLYPPFRHSTPVALLSHITYPLTTRFKIHMHVTHATLTPGLQDLPYAHLASRGLDFKSALLSPIDAPRQPGLRLRCWSSRAIPDIFNLDQRPPAPLDLRVTRGADTPDAVAVAALSALAKAANLASVRRLAVAPLRPDVPWARVLARAPQLSELSIYGPAVVDNLLLACTTNGHSAPYIMGEFAHSPFLKRLETLNIFGLNLVSSSPSNSPPTYGRLSVESHHTPLASLLSLLPRRIEELCVCYCDARASDMDLLAPLVNGERIVWDGSTNGTKSLPLSMFPRGVSARAAGHNAVGPGAWAGMDEDDWPLGGEGGGDGGVGFGFAFGGHNHHQHHQHLNGLGLPAFNPWNPPLHPPHHFGVGHIHPHQQGMGEEQPPAIWLPVGGGGQHQAPHPHFHHGAAHHHGAGLAELEHMSDSDDENVIGEINPATLVNPEAIAAAEQQAQALDQALAQQHMPLAMQNGPAAPFLQGHIQAMAQNGQGQQAQPAPVPALALLQNQDLHAAHWEHGMTDEQAAAALQAIINQANAVGGGIAPPNPDMA